MRLTEESFKSRSMFNELQNNVKKEIESFNARFISFAIEDQYEEGGRTYFTFRVEADITGLDDDMIESLKSCLSADLLLYDFNQNYVKKDVHYVFRGTPKKKGFFSRLFG